MKGRRNKEGIRGRRCTPTESGGGVTVRVRRTITSEAGIGCVPCWRSRSSPLAAIRLEFEYFTVLPICSCQSVNGAADQADFA